MFRDRLLTLSDVIEGFARLRPDHMGARDLQRALSYAQWNSRSNQLAQALIAMGLAPGDRVAVLAWNCLEWVEIYVAAARCGVILVWRAPALLVDVMLLGADGSSGGFGWSVL